MTNLNTGLDLASFADMVTDDIRAIDSKIPAAGVFFVEISEAKLGQNDQKEGIDPDTNEPFAPLFFASYKYRILQVNGLLDKLIEPENLLERVVSDRFTFWPKDLSDNIGLLKGRYRKVGLPIEGRMGGVEGGEPGWIDGANGAIIGLRVKHTTRNGQVYANFEWFKPELEEGRNGVTARL